MQGRIDYVDINTSALCDKYLRWSSMRSREQICSQQVHCLSCQLSVSITGKDCRELTHKEIQRYGGKEMYIDGKWYEQPELQAYVHELQDEIERLRAAISRKSEEDMEYD